MELIKRFINWFLKYRKEIEDTPDVLPVKEPEPVKLTPRERLWLIASTSLKIDVSPKDIAPDEYGCMESVDNVYCIAFGQYINGTKEKVIVSTTKGYETMRNNPSRFKLVSEAKPGVIIVSPTGYSKKANTPIPNGHIGIFDKNEVIMSNTSATGKWEQNYTLKTWIDRYRLRGGYPIYYFEPI